jgi:DNA-binding transcriptional MerR regulator
VVCVNEYTAGEVARLSRVSVRTLHHYDRLGLLTPGGRTAAGYRLYSDAEEMEARKMGIALEHAQEAEQRWGETAAWKQSQRRTAAYTRDDWITIKGEADANIRDFADALRAGQRATGEVAKDLAEAHRQHISRWFYDCGFQMHRSLAEMYISDPRYTASYDEIEPGFSQYVHDAILASAERAQG